jgi:hypothetical protein
MRTVVIFHSAVVEKGRLQQSETRSLDSSNTNESTMGKRRFVSAISFWLPLVLIGPFSAPAQAGSDTVHLTAPHQQTGSTQFVITTVSARDDLISGDSALVRIGVSAPIPVTQVGVYLNNAKITTSFKETPAGSHVLQGLVTSLRRGDNTLMVHDEGNQSNAAELVLTNYAVTGPIISGPHITPYECRTAQNGLGSPLDANCSAKAKISYYYRSTSKTFKALTSPTGPYPADLASTTTTDGRSVPYIVRVEAGTINRGIYRIAILDNPAQAPTGPWKPGPGWNGKLVVTFGCCGSAQYNQGVISADAILSDTELSRGFAFANSTELFNQQHANPHLQGETLMMLKDYFIKNYGVPKWTAGTGGSGGAIQQYLIAQLYPGLLDGIQPGISFPETLMPAIWECRLLDRVYDMDPATWSPAKQAAVNGFDDPVHPPGTGSGTCRSWDQGFANIIVADYASGCGLTSFLNKPYNAKTNPAGPRCDFFDTNANLLARDPVTGFAFRPTDNVGVQYGLGALNQGWITVADFLELNAAVGGFNVDGHPQGQRMATDADTLARVYRGGFLNSFVGGGVATIPIITQRTNADSRGDIHDQLEDQIVRARLIKANGRADNQIIWRSGSTSGIDMAGLSLDLMNQWLDKIAADQSAPSTDKVANNKPYDASDTCWDLGGNKIVQPATMDLNTQCNRTYPYFSQPQLQAGQALTRDVLKCALKSITKADYNVSFTPAEWTQLNSIFPNGVCDYSRPGIGQQPLLGTYLLVQ